MAAAIATAYAAAKHKLFLTTLTLPFRKPIGERVQQDHRDLYPRNYEGF
jgi:hypothetical protein